MKNTKLLLVVLCLFVSSGCIYEHPKLNVPATSQAIQALNAGTLTPIVFGSEKTIQVAYNDGSALTFSVQEGSQNCLLSIVLLDKEQKCEAVTLNLQVQYKSSPNGLTILDYSAWANSMYGYALEYDYSRGGCRYSCTAVKATGYFDLRFWERRITLWGYNLHPTLQLHLCLDNDILTVDRLTFGPNNS